MLHRRWNIWHSPVSLDAYSQAIEPGQAHDFTDEEVEHLGPTWAAENPRAGLEQERAFWARRRIEADQQTPKE